MNRIIAMLAVLMLTGCTVVRYQSTDRTLTVIDVHPEGETLSLQGTLDSIGTLDVNRDTSDSTAITGGHAIASGFSSSGVGSSTSSDSLNLPRMDIPKGTIVTLAIKTLASTDSVTANMTALEEW